MGIDQFLAGVDDPLRDGAVELFFQQSLFASDGDALVQGINGLQINDLARVMNDNISGPIPPSHQIIVQKCGSCARCVVSSSI
jgi:hypothetical protein